ncbi:MAG: transposase [Muribaculaceae bacterium]|nr:transposase [Muribaculaceae bacterium]
MSYVNALYHIVFSTWNRKKMLLPDQRPVLFRYMAGIIESEGVRLLAINGVGNHLHILVDLPATVRLADLTARLKRSSSLWMKKDGRFPLFEGWGKEYFTATISHRDKPAVIRYIQQQELHHGVLSYENELDRLLTGAGLTRVGAT